MFATKAGRIVRKENECVSHEKLPHFRVSFLCGVCDAPTQNLIFGVVVVVAVVCAGLPHDTTAK